MASPCIESFLPLWKESCIETIHLSYLSYAGMSNLEDTLVPSGFIKIPLKRLVSSEISLDCLNCKLANE